MSWRTHRIEELCTLVTSGGTPATSEPDYYGGNIPWLRTQEVTFNRISDTDIKISEKGLNNSAAKWVPANSVIVAMYGNSAGRVATNLIPLTTNQACCNLIVDAALADFRFIYYRLVLDYEVLHGLAKGAAQNNLNAGQVRQFSIRTPGFAEQRRIADILSTYDDLIENNKKRIELLEVSARLLYREWFVHLRFPGHEHLKVTNGVPEGWSMAAIADMFDTTSGGTPTRDRLDFFEGDINWVKTQELDERPIFETTERITEDAVRRSSAKLLPDHTLLVSIYGGTNIGRTGVLALPGTTNQACVALLPKRRKEEWIFAQLWIQHNRDYLIGLAQGAAQTNINQETLRGLNLLRPPNSLLDTFLDSVLDGYRQIECLVLQNRKLADARNLLLPRLMSGGIAT